MHVMPAVSRFLQRYPKTRIDLLLLDRVVDLLEEGIDVAVRIAHLADSSLIARPLGVCGRSSAPAPS
jgi:DNA-binding transcriptional LysR family regulator